MQPPSGLKEGQQVGQLWLCYDRGSRAGSESLPPKCFCSVTLTPQLHPKREPRAQEGRYHHPPSLDHEKCGQDMSCSNSGGLLPDERGEEGICYLGCPPPPSLPIGNHSFWFSLCEAGTAQFHGGCGTKAWTTRASETLLETAGKGQAFLQRLLRG